MPADRYDPLRFEACRQSSVLIIDDNPDHRLLMQSALEHFLPRITYTWASSAKATLDHLTECISRQQPLPRLVLLDLYLPEREQGLQLLRALKCNRTFQRIPVIVISYSADPNEVSEMYQEGTNSYLVKPTGYDQWLACFKTIKAYWWDAVTLPEQQH